MIRPTRSHLNSRSQTEYQYARGYGSNPTSRKFNGSSQYLLISSADDFSWQQSQPTTCAAWFYDTAGSAGFLIGLCHVGGNEYCSVEVNGGQKVRGGFSTAGNKDGATSYDLNKWNHACYVNDSNVNGTVYLNGVADGTRGGSGSFPGNTRICIGSYRGATPGRYFTGSIGEACVWKSNLSAADVLFLNTPIEINGVIGFPPAFLVKPAYICAYYPLFGNNSPEVCEAGPYGPSTTNATLNGPVNGDKNMAITGATKSDVRPPIVYPPMSWSTDS